MKMKILFHDNCFDGAASAAVFSKFYKEKVNPTAVLEYQGLSHQAGGKAIDPAVFTGDENAILDFRYSQDPRLTWWFDHHQSAFQMPGDEPHFRADNSGKKFHDPKRKSCTKYLTDTVKEKFGFDTSSIQGLIDWAELIDGAQFSSPQMAVELKEAPLRLMMVLEANKDPTLIPRVIQEMQHISLEELVSRPHIQTPLQPLLERHQKSIDVVKKKARLEDGIVVFDVADEGYDSLNKFISYYLYPEARYTVWVGRGQSRSKISVGSNPWRPELRKHDLSKLAERYGGGGHPVVAGISMKHEELEKARQAAREIIEALKH